MTKKNVCAILLALACIFSACSADDKSTLRIAKAVIEENPTLEFFSVYSTDFEETDAKYFSSDMLILTLGKNGALPETELIFSATAIFSPRQNLGEIIIFSLYDKSQAPDIIKICERRIEKLKKYAKSATENEMALAQNAKIVTKENYVILLVTYDNSHFERQIFDLI